MEIWLEAQKRVKGRVSKEQTRRFSKSYNEQCCYIVQFYDPKLRLPVGATFVKTTPTLTNILKGLEKQGLYPLILPQPVYVPGKPKEWWRRPFWERYRHSNREGKAGLIKEYGLLKDSSIYRFQTVTLDIDSPFEDVYPAWNELREKLGIEEGYQVYKTKSGRFRAYIYLDGTKDLKRARELTAILYAFFEGKGFNADPTFVHRLNHPVFYEDFPLYHYKLIEDVSGKVAFFSLYRKVKELQKKLKLYTFKGKDLTTEIWGIKPPKRGKKKKGKGCQIIKAPAFIRKLRNESLDVFELWKLAVTSLSNKHASYRYTYVIQPAVGWAKYLGLPKGEVSGFLISLLGGEKRRDIETGWRYASELEFRVPESVKWAGKTRDEWELKAVAYFLENERAARQELIREVFANQKWLCDLIMNGLAKKQAVSFVFETYGRGRPRKIFELAGEARVPIRKAVGFAGNPFYLSNFYFSQNNNSLLERAIGGGWYSCLSTCVPHGVAEGLVSIKLSRSYVLGFPFFEKAGISKPVRAREVRCEGEKASNLMSFFPSSLLGQERQKQNLRKPDEVHEASRKLRFDLCSSFDEAAEALEEIFEDDGKT